MWHTANNRITSLGLWVCRSDARPCVAEAAECVLAGLLREGPRPSSFFVVMVHQGHEHDIYALKTLELEVAVGAGTYRLVTLSYIFSHQLRLCRMAVLSRSAVCLRPTKVLVLDRSSLEELE